VVYAWLLSHAGDQEARDEIIRQIYAPMGGWDAAEHRLFAAIMATPDEPEGG
jgi:hypothetical protein